MTFDTKEISIHPEILSRLSEQHIRSLHIRYSHFQPKTFTFSAYGKQPFFADSVSTQKEDAAAATVTAGTSNQVLTQRAS